MVRKIGKIVLYILGVILLVGVSLFAYFQIKWHRTSSNNLKALGPPVEVLEQNGYSYRDLNKNGRLDLYEDARVDDLDRVENLLSQMTVDEKAGLLFITMALMNEDGSVLEIPKINNPFTMMLPTISTMIVQKHMNHFNLLQAVSAEGTISWVNEVQKLAERTRLGIPVTLATDPRHGKEMNIGTSISTRFFSRWPSQLGLAATMDSSLVREFGDIARQDYVALGIRVALHPMADLATEPRWARTNGTFGEDAQLSAKLTEAYILGFQGDSIHDQSVACMTKHFPGGGPQEDGWDAHFESGINQVYPGDNFDYHLIPFIDGAFKAGTSQIMPYYGVPVGQTSADVAFAYNKEIIQDLLRDSLGFEGIICTDWGLVTDMPVKKASAWGVEHLTELERVEKILNAGCDMLGGETRQELVVELVESGRISESRIDESIRRILLEKFRLGLFDDPFVDPTNVEIVGTASSFEKGREAQRKSLVLLKNESEILPLSNTKKIYAHGFAEQIESNAHVVDDIQDADVILLKLSTPYSPPKGNSFLEKLIHQGRLDFPEEEKAEILNMINQKPTVTVLTMERPTVAPDIVSASQAVIADFECEDDIILELVFGEFNPTARLPIEIPSSPAAVEAQLEDLPYDSKDPLFPYGHGLSFQVDSLAN